MNNKQYKGLTVDWLESAAWVTSRAQGLPLLIDSPPGPFAEEWPEPRKVTSVTESPSPWERRKAILNNWPGLRNQDSILTPIQLALQRQTALELPWPLPRLVSAQSYNELLPHTLRCWSQ